MRTAPKYRLLAIPMTMRCIAPLDIDHAGFERRARSAAAAHKMPDESATARRLSATARAAASLPPAEATPHDGSMLHSGPSVFCNGATGWPSDRFSDRAQALGVVMRSTGVLNLLRTRSGRASRESWCEHQDSGNMGRDR